MQISVEAIKKKKKKIHGPFFRMTGQCHRMTSCWPLLSCSLSHISIFATFQPPLFSEQIDVERLASPPSPRSSHPGLNTASTTRHTFTLLKTDATIDQARTESPLLSHGFSGSKTLLQRESITSMSADRAYEI